MGLGFNCLYEEKERKTRGRGPRRGKKIGKKGGKRTSQELVLAKVHPLDDVSTVVEYAADVLRVHSTGKVRVAVMLAISTGRADALYREPVTKEHLSSVQLEDTEKNP